MFVMASTRGDPRELWDTFKRETLKAAEDSTGEGQGREVELPRGKH